MKIGVISDTHGDVKAWRKALYIFKDVNYIIHTGDILYHGPFNPILPSYNPLKLAQELNESPIPVIFAKGNCDSSVDTLALEYPIENPYVFVFANGLRIMVNHGDALNQRELVKSAKKYKINFLITGHTHVPQLEKRGDIILLNPGSPSLPKEKKIPTVALIKIREVKKEVEIIEVEKKKVIKRFLLEP